MSEHPSDPWGEVNYDPSADPNADREACWMGQPGVNQCPDDRCWHANTCRSIPLKTAPEATDPTPGEVGLSEGERDEATGPTWEAVSLRGVAAHAIARAEAAEAREAELRAAWEGLMSDATRRLMAQAYLIDRNDYHGQDLTRHAQAMLAALRAALTTPPTTEGGE